MDKWDGRGELAAGQPRGNLTGSRTGAYSRVAMMHRRTVLRALLGSAMVGFAAPLAVEAQQAGKIPRIGLLANVRSPGIEA